MYQRSKIQEESLYYENLETHGRISYYWSEYLLKQKGSPTIIPGEVIRKQI